MLNKTNMPGKAKGAVDSLKYSKELTLLASCLGDCLSGLEDVGRDWMFSSYSLLLDERKWGRETEREMWEANLQCKYAQHVSGVASCLSVCIWMCLRRQAASLFTQINIWHWLHGLWSVFHPIWTINVSAIHQAVSMYSPQGTNLWPAQSFYNHITSIIVPHHVHHGLNKHLYRKTAYNHWHTNIGTSHS